MTVVEKHLEGVNSLETRFSKRLILSFKSIEGWMVQYEVPVFLKYIFDARL